MTSSTILRRRSLRTLALAGTSTLAAMLLAETASAGELTWDGSSGSDWANPASWSPESVPTAADEVVVPAGPTGAGVDPSPVIDNVAAEAKGVEILGNMRLSAMLGWRHAFGEVVSGAHRFAVGGTGFSVAGVPLVDDAVAVEAGLDLAIAPALTLGLGYSGQFGRGVSDSGVQARFGFRF